MAAIRNNCGSGLCKTGSFLGSYNHPPERSWHPAAMHATLPQERQPGQAVRIRAHDGNDNGSSNNDDDEDDDRVNVKEKGLDAGPLWRLMRTARNEHPALRLRLIDIGEEKTALEALAPALMLGADEPECAMRHGRVLVPQIHLATYRSRSSSSGDSSFDRTAPC